MILSTTDKCLTAMDVGLFPRTYGMAAYEIVGFDAGEMDIKRFRRQGIVHSCENFHKREQNSYRTDRSAL